MGNEIVKAGSSEIIEAYQFDITPAELSDIITENIGTNELKIGNLDRAVNPGGKSTKWEVPTLEGTDMVSEIEGVIVFHKIARARWQGEYKGGGEAPVCRSVDGFIGEGDPGGKCKDCPYAKFSDDGENPECKLVKQLFIRRPGKVFPMVLNVTAINLKKINKYLFTLADNLTMYNHVVTRVTATTATSKNGRDYPQFHFAAAAKLPKEQAAEMDEYKNMVKPLLSEVEMTTDDVTEKEDYSSGLDEEPKF